MALRWWWWWAVATNLVLTAEPHQAQQSVILWSHICHLPERIPLLLHARSLPRFEECCLGAAQPASLECEPEEVQNIKHSDVTKSGTAFKAKLLTTAVSSVCLQTSDCTMNWVSWGNFRGFKGATVPNLKSRKRPLRFYSVWHIIVRCVVLRIWQSKFMWKSKTPQIQKTRLFSYLHEIIMHDVSVTGDWQRLEYVGFQWLVYIINIMQ